VARLILDTSVVIEAERTGVDVLSFGNPDDAIALAAVTAAELLVGAALATPKRRSRRRQLVERVIEGLDIVDYDLHVARAHAELMEHTHRTGTQRGAHDLIIAATARATSRTVLTMDGRGFDGLPGVAVVEARPGR
jgi:tRNA(fMet)-specific endonuclease VapC